MLLFLKVILKSSYKLILNKQKVFQFIINYIRILKYVFNIFVMAIKKKKLFPNYNFYVGISYVLKIFDNFRKFQLIQFIDTYKKYSLNRY